MWRQLWEILPEMTQKGTNQLMVIMMAVLSVLMTVNGVLLYDWKTTTEARIAALEIGLSRIAVLESNQELLMQLVVVDRGKK